MTRRRHHGEHRIDNTAGQQRHGRAHAAPDMEIGGSSSILGPLMSTSTLEAVSAARWRIAISLTIAMMVVYFGFVLLVAFNKPLLGAIVTRGLSLGMT